MHQKSFHGSASLMWLGLLHPCELGRVGHARNSSLRAKPDRRSKHFSFHRSCQYSTTMSIEVLFCWTMVSQLEAMGGIWWSQSESWFGGEKSNGADHTITGRASWRDPLITCFNRISTRSERREVPYKSVSFLYDSGSLPITKPFAVQKINDYWELGTFGSWSKDFTTSFDYPAALRRDILWPVHLQTNLQRSNQCL